MSESINTLFNNGNSNGNGNNGGNGGSSNTELPAKIVGVIYSDVKREYFPTEAQYITEKNAMEDAKLIAKELENIGLEVKLYPGNEFLAQSIRHDKPDMVFNLVDSIKGNEYLSATIPGLLDTLDVPYTGAGLLGLALCYDKFMTRNLLRNSGIPTPNFQLFYNHNEPLNIDMRFPLISKLNAIHGGVEMTKDSVSENEKHLRDRIKFLVETYKQPVLVEEYIAGREITVLLLEGSNTKVYMAEKLFNKKDEKYVFATFEDSWGEEDTFTYQKFEDNYLKELARKAFELTRMDGYGKFDIRMDLSGRFYFIDSNLNPAFGPKQLMTAMGLIIENLYGVPFPEILARLIRSTMADADKISQNL